MSREEGVVTGTERPEEAIAGSSARSGNLCHFYIAWQVPRPLDQLETGQLPRSQAPSGETLPLRNPEPWAQVGSTVDARGWGPQSSSDHSP